MVKDKDTGQGRKTSRRSKKGRHRLRDMDEHEDEDDREESSQHRSTKLKKPKKSKHGLLVAEMNDEEQEEIDEEAATPRRSVERRPARNSAALGDGRTYDQPVNGLFVANGVVTFYIHRDVEHIAPSYERTSKIEQIQFRRDALEAFTSQVKRSAVCRASAPSAALHVDLSSNCKEAYCTSAGNDCCAPGTQARTCSHGFVAVSAGGPEWCDSWYTCCPATGRRS